MPLDEYKKKRAFNKTPEHIGGKINNSTLKFLAQKHAASHLNYDFRLKLRGVLECWAVPKGPPLDPKEKDWRF
jgi:bifunctional non-homologous end joining protein LigD